MADYNYYNRSPRYTDPKMSRLKGWESMFRANPYFAAGAILGQGLGTDYWERKEKKRTKGLDDAWKKYLESQGVSSGNSIGADEKKGVNGVPESAGNKSNDYYASMNKAFDEYRNGDNGRVLYEGRNSNAPKTPQQNNTSGVTVGNVDNGGGVTSVADAWNKMANGSGYNPGNTTMFTNGARNLGNVIGADANGVYGVPGVIGADANGVYGIPGGGSAPSATNIPRSPQTAAPNPNPTPIPYTAEQLAQIQAQGYSPEELQRMGAAELIAPVTQATVQGGGYVAPAATPVAKADVGAAPRGNEMSPSSLAYGNEVRGLEGNVMAEAAPDSSIAYPMTKTQKEQEQIGLFNRIMAAANRIPEDEDDNGLATAAAVAQAYANAPGRQPTAQDIAAQQRANEYLKNYLRP